METQRLYMCISSSYYTRAKPVAMFGCIIALYSAVSVLS